MNSNHSCSCGGPACDCCTGPQITTPHSVANPPGLSELHRRVGIWDSFRESMIARLAANADFPALAGLRTREPADPSLALLDAAAVVGDVLTFYNERVANESYLRTATERRSLTELGKLVGYRPRPGVAASAWLAFTLEAGYAIQVPAGTRVQSVPSKPEDKAQTFETTTALAARAELNAMRPRLSIQQEISPANVLNAETVWLRGTGLNLKPGDLLLFVFPTDEEASTPRKIHAVAEDQPAQRTAVTLVVEKLSAAYYLPVLQKAALAMLAAVPAVGPRAWATELETSLGRFSEALGTATSLSKIEKLFQAQIDPPDRGLDETLKPAVAEGEIAGNLATGLAQRASWAADLTAAWQKILSAAQVSASADAKSFVAARLGDLSAGNLATAVGKILDTTGTNSLSDLIDSATPEMKPVLESLKSALTEAWNPIETLIRSELTSGSSTDAAFVAIVQQSAGIVADLPDPDNLARSRATAYLTAAEKYRATLLGDDGNSESKGDLAAVAAIGGLAASLTGQRVRFRSESVSGLSRALRLLAGRYAKIPNAAAAEEVAKLAAVAGGTHSLEEMATALETSLAAISKLVTVDSNTALLRLKAELLILNGQVSPGIKIASPSLDIANVSSAALGDIVAKNVLKAPDAPDAPLSVKRSLGAFLPVASEGTSAAASDAISRLAGRLAGSSDDDLFAAWRKLNTGGPEVEVHAMRVQTAVFGAAAPMRFGPDADKSFDARFSQPHGYQDWTPDGNDLRGVVRLDGEHGNVVRDGWIVIERPQTIPQPDLPVEIPIDHAPKALKSRGFFNFNIGDVVGNLDFVTFQFFQPNEVTQTLVRRVSDVRSAPHSAYSVSGKATTVSLLQENEWGMDAQLGFGVIRRTKVYAASELMELAEIPVSREAGRPIVKNGSAVRTPDNPFVENDEVLVLDGLYQGLAPGHRLILAGQRADSVSQRPVREYALVSKIEHVLTPSEADPQHALAGDSPHTRVTLSKPLQYVYRRNSLTIYGNVAEATHGETKREVLGSGNARAASQAFPLRSVPVTYVPAATAQGVASTAAIRVDKILWKEADQFTATGPGDRIYVVEIAGDGSTRAVFGDGVQGARLPTGAENVTAVYRTGIGQGGNVGAESLSTLLDRPLGLKGVQNPLAASGGADRDGPDDIRRNVPLPLVALDRLVSVSDYAAFSRVFAGIGKAEARLLHAASGSIVHVTIAGQNDGPISETSALVIALTQALGNLGDPALPVRVQPRELLVLLLAANVRIDAERAWADVEPAIRAAMLTAFGFARRELGQDVFVSQAIATIQAVPGVDYVDVDSFAGISQNEATANGRIALTPNELEAAVHQGILSKTGELLPPPPRLSTATAGLDKFGHLRPAQLAMFLPDLPETLILNQIQP